MCDDHGRIGWCREGCCGVGGVVACASIKSSTHSASDADLMLGQGKRCVMIMVGYGVGGREGCCG